MGTAVLILVVLCAAALCCAGIGAAILRDRRREAARLREWEDGIRDAARHVVEMQTVLRDRATRSPAPEIDPSKLVGGVIETETFIVDPVFHFGPSAAVDVARMERQREGRDES